MYTLTHEGENVGRTKLERGDPTTYSVSGAFENIGGAAALAAWLISIGAEQDDGVVFVDLNPSFTLVNPLGEVLKFDSGSLIAVPGEDEAFLDIVGLSEADYKAHFPQHIAALAKDGKKDGK